MVSHDWSPSHTWKYGVLFWMVGLSSWISITGLFAELSLISFAITEGFEIWSYITLIIQLANIGPLIYSIIPRSYKTQNFVICCGYFIFILGFLSMLALSLCWNQQTTILGHPRSLALYLLTFCSALTDCLTSIIFWIFVAYFPTQYMASLSAGESSSGIISAILIWIQQSGRPEDEPRFSVSIYLLIISCLIPISAVAFTLLVRSLRNGTFDDAKDWISRRPHSAVSELDIDGTTINSEQHNQHDASSTSLSQRWTNSMKHNQSILSIPDPETEMVQSNMKQNGYHSMGNTITNGHGVKEEENESNMTLNTNPMDGHYINSNHHHNSLMAQSPLSDTTSSSTSSGITRDINNAVLNNVASGYWCWIVMIAILSGVQNGMLPSISSFSLLPYGNDAYIYSVTIANIGTPLFAAFPAVCSSHLVQQEFVWMSAVGWVIMAGYILIVGLQSPHPMGVMPSGEIETFWTFVIVTVSVLCALFLTVCKTCIYLMIKKTFMLKSTFLDQETLEKGLSRLMEIIGIAVQLGSFCGAVLFFCLVNIAHVFHQ